MIIPFGEYLPDLNTFGMQAVTQATNVEPLANGYRSMPDTVKINTSGTIGSNPCWGFEALYSDPALGGSNLNLNADSFIGTASRLYKMNISGAITDVSRAALYSVDNSVDERWDFTQFGSKVLAVGGTSSASWFPLQTWTLGSSVSFSDVASAPGARTIGVVRDFVVVGHTYDATDGYRPTRVRWCGFGDETSWAISAATQADLQDFSDASGPVKQIVSGDTGIVFFERAIYAMEYAGPPITFRFRKITTSLGLVSRGLAIEYAGTIYFLSQSGFMALTPDGGLRQIGDGKVDKTALTSLAYAYTSSAVDQKRGLVCFRIGSYVWMYSVSRDRWATYDHSITSSGAINNIYAQKGAAANRGVAGIDNAGNVWRIGNENLSEAQALCRIDTAEMQINPQGRATTTLIRPMVEGGTFSSASVYVLRRDSQRDSLSATGALSYNAAQDYFQGNVTAKYHGFRFQAQQTNAVYLGLDIVNAKPRGRR